MKDFYFKYESGKVIISARIWIPSVLLFIMILWSTSNHPDSFHESEEPFLQSIIKQTEKNSSWLLFICLFCFVLLCLFREIHKVFKTFLRWKLSIVQTTPSQARYTSCGSLTEQPGRKYETVFKWQKNSLVVRYIMYKRITGELSPWVQMIFYFTAFPIFSSFPRSKKFLVELGH